MSEGYLGNQHLKKISTPIEWTPELFEEYAKCAKDPVYFSRKYIKIVHVDKGLVPFEMYPYQEEIVQKSLENRRVIILSSRQAGKCVHINSSIKLRNKKTGEVIEISIGEFYELYKKKNNDEKIENENDFIEKKP